MRVRRVRRARGIGGICLLVLAVTSSAARARSFEPAFDFGATASCETCHPGRMVATMDLDHPPSDAALRESSLGRVCASGTEGWAVFLASLAAGRAASGAAALAAGCERCHVEGRDPAPAIGVPTPPPRGAPAGESCVGCHAHGLDLVAAGGFPSGVARQGDASGTRCLSCHAGALGDVVARAIAAAPASSGAKPARDVHLRDVDLADPAAVEKTCFTCHLAASHRPHTIASQRGASVTTRFDPAARGGTAACQAAGCHVSPIHHDARLERHTEILACQTCHTRQLPALRVDLTGSAAGGAPAITFLGLQKPRLRWTWERDVASFEASAGAARQGAFRAKLTPFLPIEVVLDADAAKAMPGTYDRLLLLSGVDAAALAPSGKTARLAVDASDLVSADHATAPASEAARCADCHVESEGNVVTRVLREGIPLDPYHDGHLRSDFPERVPSKKHARLEHECSACHGPFRLDGVNLRCATAGCHPGMEGSHQTTGHEDCAACHFEHRGRDTLTELAPATCQSAGCHVLVHGGTELDRPEGRYGASGHGEEISTTLVFSHREHIKINEQEHRAGGCLGCHTETAQREIAIPSHEGEKGCAGGAAESCHTAAVPIEEAKKAPNRFCKECHLTPDGSVPELPPRSVHVKFRHQEHFEAKTAPRLIGADGQLDCRVCHVGDFDGNREFGEVVRKAGEYPRPMEECVACHRDGRAAALACESCHTYHFRGAR